MNDTPPQEEGFADDIVEVTAYEATLPEIKEFLPWHRPRKQYVRRHQWGEQVGRMLDESPLVDGTLKYLGLPGLDLLDLRYFHATLCEPRGIKLRFLGFNSSARPASNAHAEMSISLDEVRKLPSVDPMSDVIGDSFSLLANGNSIACRRARELGPYDVVNLDLCDGFGAQAPGEASNNYSAMNNLLSLQARSKSPWLLLLTTRADRQNIDAGVLERLLAKYLDNLRNCQTFLDVSRERFAIDTEDALRVATGTPDGLLAVFLTGLCKWFLGLALAHTPPTLVAVRSVIGYRVDPDAQHEDLISLALRFTPTFVPVGDPVGLAGQPVDLPNECILSTKAVNRISRRVDADKVLGENADLNQRMINETADLLRQARYDADAYREWLLTA